MRVSFSSSRFARCCASERALTKTYGPDCGRKIALRLSQLAAAPTLEAMRKLPQARCHELVGDRKGEIALDLVHPRRLIFRPDHDPVPLRPAGGLDWERVTAVVILEIVDYH